MKIALCQLNFKIADFDNNANKIINDINKAKSCGADLAVFSELSVCGYPPFDLLEKEDFILNCYNTLDKIAKKCVNIAVIIGSPNINKNSNGKKLFNTAVFIENGEIKFLQHKTLLPTYDIFDEYRYFEPNNSFRVLNYKNENIALTICEDLWYEQPIENLNFTQKIYSTSPLDQLQKQSPTIIINIASSPFSVKHSEIRTNVLKNNAKKYNLPLVYVNQVGANTDLIFDGGSMFINSEGKVISELKYFEEDFQIVDTQSKTINSTQENFNAEKKIYNALLLGIKDFFAKNNFKKAVIGLSGGIDSALVLALACEAIGSKNVHALLMPSRYSSEHSVNDAIAMVKNLNVTCDIISIEEAFLAFENILSPIFKGKNQDVTEENIQARIRGMLLMAYSNKFGNILLNTSNKSEAAVGYGTLYGDMAGGLSVIGDLYKTQVYEISNFINKNKEIIPHNIIQKEPSAELRPNQKDSDSLPKYSILDKILFAYIEQNLSVNKIIEMGFDKAVVEKVIRLVNASEYKRFQMPPVLRVSAKAFGIGRRIPLVAKF